MDKFAKYALEPPLPEGFTTLAGVPLSSGRTSARFRVPKGYNNEALVSDDSDSEPPKKRKRSNSSDEASTEDDKPPSKKAIVANRKAAKELKGTRGAFKT
ncbi:hypothetical protein MBLNU230_g0648t1 [Neophaeotheca triangularis]